MKVVEPIFSSKELEENISRKRKLFELVSSGDSILMVGAGCSATIYPDWTGFVELLKCQALTKDPNFQIIDNEDFLKFAERVKLCLGSDRYYNLIYREFKPKERTHVKLHEILCQLLEQNKFRAITTTNYDIVLENALATCTKYRTDNSVWIDENVEEAKIFEFLRSLNHGNASKRILHIHGRYDMKDSIILAESEYASKYGFSLIQPSNSIYQEIIGGKISEKDLVQLLQQHGLIWTKHRKILWSLFATRRVIFIGFSLNDPYFKKMLQYVSHDLHTYGQDSHFLILRITNKDKERAIAFSKEVKEEFGVETVFFEDDESFSGLENFIIELGYEFIKEDLTDKITVNEKAQSVQIKQKSQNDILLELSKKQDDN